MDRAARQHLLKVTADLEPWVAAARRLAGTRAGIIADAASAVAALRGRIVAVEDPGHSSTWQVLPLRVGDDDLLTAIGRAPDVRELDTGCRDALAALITNVPHSLAQIRVLTGIRRFLTGHTRAQDAVRHATYLTSFWEYGRATGLPDRLDGGLTQLADHRAWSIADAASPRLGLVEALGLTGRPEMAHGDWPARIPASVETIETALNRTEDLHRAALAAGEALRAAKVEAILTGMPLAAMREATRERLVIGPLEDAGMVNVQHVLAAQHRLDALPGIGEVSALRLVGAARALAQTSKESVPIRIDVENRLPQSTALLRAVAAWDRARRVVGSPRAAPVVAGLRELGAAITAETSHLVILPTASRTLGELAAEAAALATSIAGRAADTAGGGIPGRSDEEAGLWADFLNRPAHYFALLAELGLQREDEARTHGELPEEVVEAVRAVELDRTHLTCSLRGYQDFGARFALVQRKVLIGDEMGLGKTIEALALLAHLHAHGTTHTLVICPASIVTNWVREIADKTDLPGHRLHGPERDDALAAWTASGGVAVTTYESLRWLHAVLPAGLEIPGVVVDEAHYVKNPAAKRSTRTRRLIDRAGWVVLLTGTPMENRIEEFATLIGHLRPDLLEGSAHLAPRAFRRHVAPVYLRRNQEDVLTELPELVEVDEWLPFATAQEGVYRDAVAAASFAAMRQAAMLTADSAKLARLLDIVDQAWANGRKVIVFSYFRAVLDKVAAALGEAAVFGPLTGSTPAADRQQLVDDFSASRTGSVLVAQIQAGGTGLNIQAASVVVICEPQLTPTREWQAIGRARRMGQLRSVQVHRLLSEEGVDRVITERLAVKSELFEQYARVSETAGAAPEAFDVTEAELAAQVVEQERRRLFPAASYQHAYTNQPAR